MTTDHLPFIHPFTTMISDTINTSTDANQGPLLAFPELGRDFHLRSDATANTCLTQCLLRLQQEPVDETNPTWVTRLGQTVSVLMVGASGHSNEVLDALTDRLAQWTLERFVRTDAVATELLITLFRHSPRSLTRAGRTLVKGLQLQPALPAWTATLIGLLRQAAHAPQATTLAQGALAALPDGQSALSKEAFEQALSSNDPHNLRRLVGHISLLSLIDVSQAPSLPLRQALVDGHCAPTIAPDMQALVQHHLDTETVRLHWLLTPQGDRWIEAVLAKAATLFPAPTCQQLRQEIVLSLARSVAIEHRALQGAEAVLALGQLLRWVGPSPQDWAPVWVAVRQLSGLAQARPTRATPDTDRSRTANTLLCPGGLTGRLEQVGWRVAVLKQHGLPLTDFLGQLLQQAPRGLNGQPLVARVLQAAAASPQEHQQALAELCSVHGLPPHAGATAYTRHLLHRARLLALHTAQESDDQGHGTRQETLVQQVAAQLTPGVVLLGLFNHLHVELKFPDWSADGALWLMAQLQASVQALPPGVPSDWVLRICARFNDEMAKALPPAHYQQWSTWLRSL